MNICCIVLSLLPPANEVAERLCFYTCLSVILFTGGSTWAHLPPGQVHTPPGAGPPGPQCMLGYGQQAGGTHPTRMQSCFRLITQYEVSPVTCLLRTNVYDHYTEYCGTIKTKPLILPMFSKVSICGVITPTFLRYIDIHIEFEDLDIFCECGTHI